MREIICGKRVESMTMSQLGMRPTVKDSCRVAHYASAKAERDLKGQGMSRA